MFVSSTGFNCPNTNCTAPPPPPSPRKSNLAPVNWTVANSTESAMVTPRDSQQTPGEQTSSPHHHRAGSNHSHRRGSYSSVMLESTINEMHDGTDKPMHVHQSTNHEMAMDESTNGHVHQQPAAHSFAAASHQQPAMQFGAAHVQQQSFAQASAQQQKTHHSYLSSMDLMMPSSFNRPRPHDDNNASFGMFKSSSHHTSHTAAAGDLLSMSRTTNTPASRSKEHKKRTASYGGKSYRDTMSQSAFQVNAQYHHHQQQQQQHQQQQQNPQAMWSLPTPTPTTNNMVNQVSAGNFSATNGAPYQQQLHSSEESYEQNNKRRCHRSDSFEMMDD